MRATNNSLPFPIKAGYAISALAASGSRAVPLLQEPNSLLKGSKRDSSVVSEVEVMRGQEEGGDGGLFMVRVSCYLTLNQPLKLTN